MLLGGCWGRSLESGTLAVLVDLELITVVGEPSLPQEWRVVLALMVCKPVARRLIPPSSLPHAHGI